MEKPKKLKITKYPRALAEAETKSRRSYPATVNVTPETDRALLTNPAAFSLQNVYPYIFDGLTALCTDYANTTFTMNGKITKVIQGQDDDALTHYQAIVPVHVFKNLALGGNNEYWHFLETELHRMSRTPEQRLLPFAPGYLLKTHPLMVDFLYEDGTKASTIKSLENIGADRKIQFLILHFYKPLFSSILQKNSKGTIGGNYLQLPRALQAKIGSTMRELELRLKGLETRYPSGDDIGARFMRAIVEKNNAEMPEGWTYTQEINYKETVENLLSLTTIEARKILLFFACHDDRKSGYININAVFDDFLIGCFPGLVTKRKGGTVYVKPKDKITIYNKLEGFINLCTFMAKQGYLNGAQFLPLVFDEKNKRVKVRRNKTLCYNNQPELSLYS